MFDPKTKVLIVDDMPTMRKIISKILREMGYINIAEATDGAQAWGIIQSSQKPFGLIISDWSMPNCSGLELLKKVRSQVEIKKTPFILVTADAEGSQVAEAVKAGVDQYVVKPFNKEQLKAKLELAYKKYLRIAA